MYLPTDLPDPLTPDAVLAADVTVLADTSERDVLRYLPTDDEIEALRYLAPRYETAAAILDTLDTDTGTVEIPVMDLHALTTGDGADSGSVPGLNPSTALARLVWAVTFED